MNTQLLDTQSMNILNIREMANTTENALAEVRRNMRIYKAKQTILQKGWFWTEPAY